MSQAFSVAFFGYGYWGKNVLRTLMKEPKAEVKWACDLLPERLDQIQSAYPSLVTTSDYLKAISDPEIEAIVLATPADTHAKLARAGLENSKHVFVEKPMASSLSEALELAEVVRQSNCIFQVGHIFEYAEPVRLLREWIQVGNLGKLLYKKSR